MPSLCGFPRVADAPIDPRLPRQVQYCWCHHYRSHCWLHCALDFTFANNPQGFVLTTAIGVVGSVVATFLGRAIYWYVVMREPLL